MNAYFCHSNSLYLLESKHCMFWNFFFPLGECSWKQCLCHTLHINIFINYSAWIFLSWLSAVLDSSQVLTKSLLNKCHCWQIYAHFLKCHFPWSQTHFWNEMTTFSFNYRDWRVYLKQTKSRKGSLRSWSVWGIFNLLSNIHFILMPIEIFRKKFIQSMISISKCSLVSLRHSVFQSQFRTCLTQAHL